MHISRDCLILEMISGFDLNLNNEIQEKYLCTKIYEGVYKDKHANGPVLKTLNRALDFNFLSQFWYFPYDIKAMNNNLDEQAATLELLASPSDNTSEKTLKYHNNNTDPIILNWALETLLGKKYADNLLKDPANRLFESRAPIFTSLVLEGAAPSLEQAQQKQIFLKLIFSMSTTSRRTIFIMSHFLPQYISKPFMNASHHTPNISAPIVLLR